MFDPATAISAKCFQAIAAPGNQGLPICWPAGPATECVDPHLGPDETNLPKKVVNEQQHLGIRTGIVTPQNLSADLMKLAQPALLRALAPKHRPHVEHAGDRLTLLQRMFDIGPHHRCRPFRAQCQRRPIAIVEGIHLLLDNIGRLANGAAEQICPLGDRSPNL